MNKCAARAQIDARHLAPSIPQWKSEKMTVSLSSESSRNTQSKIFSVDWTLVVVVERIIFSLVYLQKPTVASVCIDIERWSLLRWSFSGFSWNRSLGNKLRAISEWRWDQTIDRDYESKCSFTQISFVLVHHDDFVETSTSAGEVSTMNDEMCWVSIIFSACFSDSASSRQQINRIVHHLRIYSLVRLILPLF